MSVPKQDRLNDLLGDRALEGLSDRDATELRSLQGGDGADDPSFDLAAAAVDLAMMSKLEPLPAHLGAKIEAGASAVLAGDRPSSFMRSRVASEDERGKRDKRDRDPVRFAGWLAAAACLAIAATAWIARPAPVQVAANATSSTAPSPRPPEPGPITPPPPAPADLRAKLLAEADAIHVDWATTKDPAAQGASGDVVWSSVEQRGYMRFHGLAANDTSKAQYQLWIFDPSQDTKTPIDGGVFDVDPSNGDVLVPINPKLRVTRPTLFAVTVEKPGGVVVSKRKRIVVLAAVKS